LVPYLRLESTVASVPPTTEGSVAEVLASIATPNDRDDSEVVTANEFETLYRGKVDLITILGYFVSGDDEVDRPSAVMDFAVVEDSFELGIGDVSHLHAY
jgi:hypothetical protein